MTTAGEVIVGRPLQCPACRNRRVCSSCSSRIRYGKPNPNGRWDALHMDEMDWRRLLLAAAEFDEMAEKYQDAPSAVEFVDWLYPDLVTRKGNKAYPEADSPQTGMERHPDPIPYVTMPKWQKR